MAQIIFHSMPDSAYLWTAMQVADEKGVSYEHQILELYSRAHFKLHPFGKMPVMQHREVILYETLAITHYIDRAFDGPAMQPADALGQAEMLRWVSIVNGYIYPVMNRFTKERIVRPAWGVDPDLGFVESAREPLKTQMRVIEETLQRSVFLAGHDLTIADCFLLPHLLFFSLTPEGRAFLAQAPATTNWLDRMQDRASFHASPMCLALKAIRQMRAPPAPAWAID